MRRVRLLLPLLLVACAHMPAHVADRLFCGLSIPNGGNVSQAEVDAFIHEVVTPRFPQGFTVWRAKGQWNGGDEEVMILEFIHPRNAQTDAAVAAIAAAYRTRFHQEAVLRVTVPARMEFEQ